MRSVLHSALGVLFLGALPGNFAFGQDISVDVDRRQFQQFANSVIGNGPQNTEARKLGQQERKLDSDSKRLVREYSSTDDSSKRRELEAELKKTVTAQFSIKQQIREKELADLEAQLERLRDRHQRRMDEKDGIVADRVQQLLREAEGLGWGGSRERSRFGLFQPSNTNPVVPINPIISPPVLPTPPAASR